MIALGCGGAGCLGLIVVVIAAGLIYFFSVRRSYSTNRRDDNFNVNTNRNSNRSSNTNNGNSSSSSSSSAASLSDEDKHKLYQAALMSGDGELVQRVSVKIGLRNEDNSPRDNYEEFIGNHVAWILRNTDFIQSISTAEKARAYVDANLPN